MKSSSLHILTKKFQQESKENGVIYVVVMKEVDMTDAGSISSTPTKVTKLFNDFSNIAAVKLPSKLPPLCIIQHAIGFITGSQLPNLLAYCMNPIEYAKLQRQVEELLSKGFICESIKSLCCPCLTNPKKIWQLVHVCRQSCKQQDNY